MIPVVNRFPSPATGRKNSELIFVRLTITLLIIRDSL